MEEKTCRKLTFYTDGGCEPNPGNGAWAVVCIEPHLEFSGIEEQTTSNRMEMFAVLEAIKKGIEMNATSISIFSDSTYVVNGFTSWMHRWAKKGWINAGAPVKNKDLWIQLFRLRRNVSLTWVRGHAGNEYNTLADEIVRSTHTRHFATVMRH